MKLTEHLEPGGVGVMATAGVDGAVNTAVYSRPHVIDEGTAAWGMTEGRTYRNVRGNPNASYMYIFPGGGYQGVRLTLRRKEIQESGSILEMIRARTRESSGEEAATAVKYVAFFEILEKRPLV